MPMILWSGLSGKARGKSVARGPCDGGRMARQAREDTKPWLVTRRDGIADIGSANQGRCRAHRKNKVFGKNACFFKLKMSIMLR